MYLDEETSPIIVILEVSTHSLHSLSHLYVSQFILPVFCSDRLSFIEYVHADVEERRRRTLLKQ